MFATISGKFIGFEDDSKCSYAVLETKRGKALVDINTDFPLRLEIGDTVEFDDTECIVVDGTIIHLVNEKTSIFIDDWGITFKQRI